MVKYNKIENEIRGKFTLNEIQELAIKNRGKNLIIDAPTASGKTEAILLAIKEGRNVTWFLPTITACTFMYRRLCRDFDCLNVKVSTSTMSEERYLSPDFTTVEIITCDPMMVEYVKDLAEFNVKYRKTDEVLVLDEIDNYPSKVRTLLKDYISSILLDQVILASATLDEELKSSSKFTKISFSHVRNKIKYKVGRTDGTTSSIMKVIKENYRRKRIAIICNSVNNIEYWTDSIYRYLGIKDNDMNIIIHHSKLPVEIKLENERKLFEEEYDLLISNDLVSVSLDIDVDMLFMEVSDKMNINIQRMGRLNRRNKKVTFRNLYFLDNTYPKFMNSNVAYRNYENFKSYNMITSDMVKRWSDELLLEKYDLEELLLEVKTAIKKGEEIALRDVPITLRYQAYKNVEKRKKGKPISYERKIVNVDDRMQSLPYDRYFPYSDDLADDDGGDRDILFMPWMVDVEHPSGEFSKHWRITDHDKRSGIYTIEPWTDTIYDKYEDPMLHGATPGHVEDETDRRGQLDMPDHSYYFDLPIEKQHFSDEEDFKDRYWMNPSDGFTSLDYSNYNEKTTENGGLMVIRG